MQSVAWLFGGGLCYTVGVIFYLLGKKVSVPNHPGDIPKSIVKSIRNQAGLK